MPFYQPSYFKFKHDSLNIKRGGKFQVKHFGLFLVNFYLLVDDSNMMSMILEVYEEKEEIENVNEGVNEGKELLLPTANIQNKYLKKKNFST